MLPALLQMLVVWPADEGAWGVGTRPQVIRPLSVNPAVAVDIRLIAALDVLHDLDEQLVLSIQLMLEQRDSPLNRNGVIPAIPDLDLLKQVPEHSALRGSQFFPGYVPAGEFLRAP